MTDAVHRAFPAPDPEHAPGAAPGLPRLARGARRPGRRRGRDGCTVHLATLEMDAGPILAQEVVPVLPGDTEEIAARADQGGRAGALPGHRGLGAGRAGGGTRIDPNRRREGADAGDDVVRALLSVYDKEGLVELAQGLSDLGWELVASGNTSAKLTRGRHRAPRGGRGDRLARDAGRPGQDAAPQDPRRHPGRPLQARAPRRPGGQRHRGHRPRRVEPVPVLLRPLHRADRHRWPGHGARRGEEPRARRHRHLAGRLPGRARGAACRRRAVGRDPAPPGPGRLRAHRRLRRGHRRLARCRRPDAGRRASTAPPRRTPRSPSSRRSSRRRCTSPSSAPRCCATARTRTSAARATGWRARRAGGTPWCSTAGTRCPTSTSSTATPPGAWCTSWRRTPAPGRRPWPSSSTPTRAAPPWRATSSPPTSGRSSATCRAPSGAWWPSAATSPPRWPTPSPPGRRPT